MSEIEIQDAIRLELGDTRRYPDLILWRNNIGVLTDARTQRHVRFGVGGPGGSDLLGIFRGRFIAAEIKTARGKQTDEQKTFGELVEDRGGEYVVLRSVEDAVRWIADLRRRFP